MRILQIFADNGIQVIGLPQTSAGAGSKAIPTIIGIVFDIIGALALLMIVVSGFRYIISAGDPQQAAKARNALLYAVIGLVIAIAAQVIVQFVVGKL